MDKKGERIGISGGTFDPVHFGHLIVAEEVRQKFSLDVVVFIPSGLPPHKPVSNVTLPEHRYQMVCSAIASNPYFEASRIEIDREGYTYTIDTLIQLNETLGKGKELFFIIGADIVKDIATWKQYDEVFKLCNFVAVLRPDYRASSFKEEIEFLNTRYGAKIYTAEAPLIGISSTIVRERVRNHQSIKYLVPESVEEYIIRNKLYCDK